MVIKIMRWEMKDMYQIILELISRTIQMGIFFIAIAPGGENNQPCWTYSVRTYQVNRGAH